MNLKKRLQYIWDYYKLPLIGIPLAILLIIFVVKSLSVNTEPDFSLYLINHTVTEEARAAFEASLCDTLCPDADASAVYVDATLTITPSSPDYESQMSFTTAIAGHTIDVMIADGEFLTFYAAKDAFYDLSELLPEELYEQLTPYLLYAEDANGISHAYGLDVSDCPLLAELGLNAPVLTVAKGTEHVDMVLEFVRVIASLLQ
ncbi:MAG: hypothetical protein J6K53_17795 [Roseburia sp.]|nr:hypothetical protein [Roseburia sp.]